MIDDYIYGIMADGVVFNELLCFLCNYFGKVPKTCLITTVVGFYEEDEIVKAKGLIYEFAEKCQSKSDNMPRLRQRKGGDNKRRLDVEDIYSMLEFLDKSQIEPPQFGALNLLRIPSIRPEEADIVKLATSVSGLQQLFREMQEMVKSLTQKESVPPPPESAAEPSGCDTPSNDEPPSAVEQKTVNKRYSDLPLFRTKDVGGEWYTVAPKKKQPEPPRRIIGATTSDSVRLKAVSSSQQTWHVFVGRLEPETTVDDLSDFVSEFGVGVVKCSLLRATQEWQNKFAAFHLVVDNVDKDKVFDCVPWPKGVDVRDWIFKKQ